MCVAIVPGGLSDKRGPAGRRRSGAQADKGQLCASGPSSDPCPALVSVAGPERHRGPGARLAESGSLVGTEAWPARHGQPQSPGLGPPHCLLLPGRGALPPSPWPRIPFPGSEAVEDTGVRPSRAFWGPGSRHGQGSPKTPGAGLWLWRCQSTHRAAHPGPRLSCVSSGGGGPLLPCPGVAAPTRVTAKGGAPWLSGESGSGFDRNGLGAPWPGPAGCSRLSERLAAVSCPDPVLTHALGYGAGALHCRAGGDSRDSATLDRLDPASRVAEGLAC